MNELLKRLNKSRKAKAEAMKVLLENVGAEERSMTEDENKLYEDLESEYDNLTRQIEKLEKQQKREKDLDELQTPPLFAGDKTKTKDKTKDKTKNVDIKRYSLMRAIQAQATGDWSKAKYERKCSLEIADTLGREAKGMFVPYEVQRNVLSTANSSALVGTEHRDDMFIEALEAESIVIGLGARVLTGLVGNVDIPKALGGISFDWIAEDEDAPATDASFGTVSLTPKTIAGAVAISRKLMKQSSISVERLIEADIRRGVALAIDEAVIAGDGTGNSPIGIINTTGVNTQAISDTTNSVPTFAETVGFETALAEDNALRGSLAYITTPKINGLTKTKPIDTGSGIFLNKDNIMNGYKVVGSSLVPANKTIFGNYNDIIIGMWGVMDLVVDTATKASSGGLVLRVFQEIDVAIRHPQSFTVSS